MVDGGIGGSGRYKQGDQLSGKPGNVYQGKGRELIKSQENVWEKKFVG